MTIRAAFTFLLIVSLADSSRADSPSGASPCSTAKPTTTCIVNMEPGSLCTGTPDRDVIIGSAESDVIFGGDGPDQIIGGDGDDIICGEGGDDTLFGDSGDDVLDGGTGGNVLSAGDGTDSCFGEAQVTSNCESSSRPKSSSVSSGCAGIIGKWHWFDNGLVEFTESNEAQWYEPMTSRKGHHAKWRCDSKNGTVTIPWTNGFTDTMKVIASGTSLQGKNNRGMTIWAQRVPND